MKKLVALLAVFALVFSPVTLGYVVESTFSGVDGEWTTPGNWSNGVPGAGDDAIIKADVSAIGGGSGTASVLSAVFNDNARWNADVWGITLTVGGGTGMATFNGRSLNYYGTINGNATFNNSSYNNHGTINGNATFNGNSYNHYGTINGSATFNGISFNNYGTINGDMYIKSNWWSGGAEAPKGNELVIANGKYWSGSVSGKVYDSSTVPVEVTQYTFNGNSRNNSTITGNATFNDSSYNDRGTITGDMYIKSNWWSGGAGAPKGNELVIANGKYWSGSVSGKVYDSSAVSVEITQYTFNGSSYNYYGTINGNVTFNGSSYNHSGTINGNVIFNDSSYNRSGTINGNTTFNGSSRNVGTINGSVVFNLTNPNAGDQAGTINAGEAGTVSGNFRTTSGITFLGGTVSSNINGTGGVTKSGAGTVTLSGTNTYTGVTRLREGVLSVSVIGDGGVAGNIGQATNAAGNLVFNGGTLRYTGATASTNRNFTISANKTATIEVTGAANTLTVSGVSTATNGSLTKSGAGTLLLSGTNLYTGATNVNAGTLRVDGSIASSSLTTVQTAGTLSGSGTTGNLTIANGGTLSPGDSPGTITTDGNAT
ncbi:MAG TPA: autotransporter-associated beta strand repeat-containing protein, partial [Candidatus Omnitrophota bacterium]|nr:autotransporter-associated beta strand repeat-containing protein [Candidatus Omnitrophota bacterium]